MDSYTTKSRMHYQCFLNNRPSLLAPLCNKETVRTTINLIISGIDIFFANNQPSEASMNESSTLQIVDFRRMKAMYPSISYVYLDVNKCGFRDGDVISEIKVIDRQASVYHTTSPRELGEALFCDPGGPVCRMLYVTEYQELNESMKEK